MSMTNTDWHNRPYYTLDAWCKNQFHYKCYKVALNAHMNCPNRDGSIGTRGCIFCSEGGSGEFAVDIRGLDIQKQLNEGIRRIAGKLPDTSFEKPCIIAYFQAYTNTYAPLPYLKEVFTEALSCPMVLGISVATRPDCLPGEVIRAEGSFSGEVYLDRAGPSDHTRADCRIYQKRVSPLLLRDSLQSAFPRTDPHDRPCHPGASE